jgi:hypothetical protein
MRSIIRELDSVELKIIARRNMAFSNDIIEKIQGAHNEVDKVLTSVYWGINHGMEKIIRGKHETK